MEEKNKILDKYKINNMKQGQQMLQNIDDVNKGKIEQQFGSLENFYQIVYFREYLYYQFFKDSNKALSLDNCRDQILNKLEQADIDFMLAEDIVCEIEQDFGEVVLEKHMQAQFGSNWKESYVELCKQLGLDCLM